MQGENQQKWKKSEQEQVISSVKHVTRKFRIVVMQNYGKVMYKKMCCTCKVVVFLLIKPIDFLPFLLPSPFSITLSQY